MYCSSGSFFFSMPSRIAIKSSWFLFPASAISSSHRFTNAFPSGPVLIKVTAGFTCRPPQSRLRITYFPDPSGAYLSTNESSEMLAFVRSTSESSHISQSNDSQCRRNASMRIADFWLNVILSCRRSVSEKYAYPYKFAYRALVSLASSAIVSYECPLCAEIIPNRRRLPVSKPLEYSSLLRTDDRGDDANADKFARLECESSTPSR
mmetsp:Transcript_1806/g.3911  ORF Transcript_1806/g.3911 Transcript_1806/m.3911 type:complete len:207 (+) Transcript_1806:2754-3374(+)